MGHDQSAYIDYFMNSLGIRIGLVIKHVSHYSHLNSLPSAFAYLDLHNVHRPTVVLLDKFSVMSSVRNNISVRCLDNPPPLYSTVFYCV